MMIASVLVGLSACRPPIAWHVAGPAPVLCNIGSYPVKIPGETLVDLYVHMNNGKSMVSTMTGPHAGEPMTCPTERIMPR
jgi:hypothetical protein